ncbi:MAG: hypothetical protein ACI9M1_001401 [Porticoccaceae bacterium]|jgi:hypothetical protein
MFYKIYLAVLLLFFWFFLNNLFFSDANNLKGTEISKVIKASSETNEEIV